MSKVINIRYVFSAPDWDEALEHLSEKEIRGLLYLGGLGYVNKIVGEKQAIEHDDILEERGE